MGPGQWALLAPGQRSAPVKLFATAGRNKGFSDSELSESEVLHQPAFDQKKLGSFRVTDK